MLQQDQRPASWSSGLHLQGTPGPPQGQTRAQVQLTTEESKFYLSLEISLQPPVPVRW